VPPFADHKTARMLSGNSRNPERQDNISVQNGAISRSLLEGNPNSRATEPEVALYLNWAIKLH
jgi:hypothetical protein